MTRFLIAVGLALSAGMVQAQQYPVKPVRVIVSTVPGPLDTYARIISEKVSTSLNRSGNKIALRAGEIVKVAIRPPAIA